MVEVSGFCRCRNIGRADQLTVGCGPGEVVANVGQAIPIVGAGNGSGQIDGKGSGDLQRSVAVNGDAGRGNLAVHDVLRADVGGSSKAQTVNQRVHVGVVGGHPNTHMNCRVLVGVEGNMRWQREVLIGGDGLLLRVEEVEQQGCSVGRSYQPSNQP